MHSGRQPVQPGARAIVSSLGLADTKKTSAFMGDPHIKPFSSARDPPRGQPN